MNSPRKSLPLSQRYLNHHLRTQSKSGNDARRCPPEAAKIRTGLITGNALRTEVGRQIDRLSFQLLVTLDGTNVSLKNKRHANLGVRPVEKVDGQRKWRLSDFFPHKKRQRPLMRKRNLAVDTRGMEIIAIGAITLQGESVTKAGFLVRTNSPLERPTSATPASSRHEEGKHTSYPWADEVSANDAPVEDNPKDDTLPSSQAERPRSRRTGSERSKHGRKKGEREHRRFRQPREKHEPSRSLLGTLKSIFTS
ncbi:hypothetical protein LTR28_008149 [Elasticomyces elasticus]|nr:hypothetical protein LTR28_008149 [Elasticomyces elasticus]